MQLELLFVIAALIISVIIHEVAHGYAAQSLGDPTARIAGRLTLNPAPHIDMFGSIIIPGLLVISGSPFLFGYAKPVPYNPFNLRNQRWGEAFVAAAGPLANIAIALLLAIALSFANVAGVGAGFMELGATIVYINILLAIVNLIPLPPLDGSKVILPFLPGSLRMTYQRFRGALEMNPFIAFGVILLVVFLFAGPIFGFIADVTSFLVGPAFAF